MHDLWSGSRCFVLVHLFCPDVAKEAAKIAPKNKTDVFIRVAAAKKRFDEAQKSRRIIEAVCV
jgi:hypothetical protein